MKKIKYKCQEKILPFKEGDEVEAKFNPGSNTWTVEGKSVVMIVPDERFEKSFIKIKLN